MDSNEHDKFVNLSSKWFKDELAPLRTLNNIRIPWIKDSLASTSSVDFDSLLPLKNLKLLDVGCGGGILTEPLARLGASVTGIDTVRENIEFAKSRIANNFPGLDRKRFESNIEFLHSDVETLLSNNRTCYYDGIIASEVLEHVSDWRSMIGHLFQLLKANGILFITTLNRTWLSYLFAIQLAERCIVPKGTHDWDKFITPDELNSCLKKNNFRVVMVQGMTINPLTLNWKWINSTSVNFAVEAYKLSDQ